MHESWTVRDHGGGEPERKRKWRVDEWAGAERLEGPAVVCAGRYANGAPNVSSLGDLENG